MHCIWSALNPPESIVNDYDVVKGFAKTFQKKFPSYDEDLLIIISKTFLVDRIRFINTKASIKYVRAAKKTVEYAANNQKICQSEPETESESE